MKVIELTDANKSQIIKEWEAMGLRPNDKLTLEDAFLDDCHAWYAVCSEKNETIVAFEIRKVLDNYIKPLKVFYGPQFDWGPGKDLEDIEAIITLVIEALGTFLAFLIDQAKDTLNRTFKIYNDHPKSQAYFLAFAKQLRDQQPDQFKAKFYKNWIEIEVK